MVRLFWTTYKIWFKLVQIQSWFNEPTNSVLYFVQCFNLAVCETCHYWSPKPLVRVRFPNPLLLKSLENSTFSRLFSCFFVFWILMKIPLFPSLNHLFPINFGSKVGSNHLKSWFKKFTIQTYHLTIKNNQRSRIWREKKRKKLFFRMVKGA